MRELKLLTTILLMCFATFGQNSQATANAGAAGQGRDPGEAGQSEASPVTAQGASAGSLPASDAVLPVPAYVLYQGFFLHLEALDRVAAGEEAKGRDGAGWRTHEQRAAHLSDDEGKILKEVAYDCNQAVSELDKKAAAAMQAAQARRPNEEPFRRSPPPELLLFPQERVEIINACIDDLRVKLGADAFKKLDDYLQTDLKPTTASPVGSGRKNLGGMQ